MLYYEHTLLLIPVALSRNFQLTSLTWMHMFASVSVRSLRVWRTREGTQWAKRKFSSGDNDRIQRQSPQGIIHLCQFLTAEIWDLLCRESLCLRFITVAIHTWRRDSGQRQEKCALLSIVLLFRVFTVFSERTSWLHTVVNQIQVCLSFTGFLFLCMYDMIFFFLLWH